MDITAINNVNGKLSNLFTREPTTEPTNEPTDSPSVLPTVSPTFRYTPEEQYALCLRTLAASGWNLFDYANYDKWFDENSFITNAQAGTFVGIENMGEIIFYLGGYYCNSFGNIGVPIPFVPIELTDNSCVLTT